MRNAAGAEHRTARRTRRVATQPATAPGVVLADHVFVGATLKHERERGELEALDIASSGPDEPKVLLRHLQAGVPVPYPRPHLHRFFELVTVSRGACFHVVDGHRIEAVEGHVSWIIPGQLHDPSGLQAGERWVLSFAPEVLGDAASGVDMFSGGRRDVFFLPLMSVVPTEQRQVTLDQAELRRWVEWHDGLERELRERQLGYGEAVRAISRLMMLFLARRALPSRPVSSSANPLVGAVFGFIEARYRSPIGLKDVAKAVGRSPAYLTDLVHRETGRSIGRWIMERRMADARRLLLETDKPIAAVGEAAGYFDTRHFAEQFKRLHGATPVAWRKSRRGVQG